MPDSVRNIRLKKEREARNYRVIVQMGMIGQCFLFQCGKPIDYDALQHILRLLSEASVSKEEYEEYVKQEIELSNHPPIRIPTKSGNRSNPEGYVYMMHNEKTDLYKIGHSCDPKSRRRAVSKDTRGHIRLIWQMYTLDRYELERSIHEHFYDKHVDSEWFALTPEDVEHIKSLE